MDTEKAMAAFSALAQETRLAAFRLLMAEGPSGVPAGEIAEKLGVPQSTLSFHLGQLERAGLVTSTRRARHILYAADLEGTRRLLGFLTEDCCRGRPEVCGTALAALATED